MSTPQLHLPPHPKQKDKKTISFSWGIFTVIVLQFVIVYMFLQKNTQTVENVNTTEHIKKAALKLEELQLYEAAVASWQEYLQKSSLSEQEYHIVYTRIAQLLQNNQQYSKALQYYFLAKETASEKSKAETVRAIKECLEQIQRFDAMTNVLREQVQANYNDSQSKSKPIAQIGARQIFTDDLSTLEKNEIDTRIDLMQVVLPQITGQSEAFRQNMQQQYSSPEGKQQLLQQHLVEEVLWRKAMENNLQNDHLFTQKILAIQKKLLAQKILERDIEQQVIVLPEEVQALYSKKLSEFEEPANAKIAIRVFSSQEEADSYSQNVNEKDFSEYIPIKITASTKEINDYGDLSSIAPKIIEYAQVGLYPEIAKTEAGFLVIWISDYHAKRIKPLQEVQHVLEKEIYQWKYQQIFERYITKLFSENKIEIFNSDKKEEKK